MAKHGTFQVGDLATHPDWPDGTTATVVGFSFAKQGGWLKNRYCVREIPTRRVVHLDREIEGDDAWMEEGLELVR